MIDGSERRADYVNFPRLCYPRNRIYNCIQLRVSEIPDGLWIEEVGKIAARWVKEKNFKGDGTIWSWCSPSIDFGNLSSVEFILPCKLPGFIDYLHRKLWDIAPRSAMKSQERFDLNEGWASICQIQEGKVWIQLDPVLWSEAYPPPSRPLIKAGRASHLRHSKKE